MGKKGQRSTFICEQCGKTVERVPGRHGKYCSGVCYAQSRIGKKRILKWTVKPGRKRGERKMLECLGCGKQMEVLANSTRQRRYCSHECYLGSRIGKPRAPWAKVEQKNCVVCGKTFEVGGLGRPPRRQQMCSDICQRQSRFRHGRESKHLSSTDAAWIAGFIDGEGSIMLHGRGTAIAFRMTASNTHKPTLQHFIDLTRIGALIWNTKKGDKNKPSGWWLVNGQAAESVLRQIISYMITKRVQADLAIDFQTRLRDPALKADRSWQLDYCLKMRQLNKRGPAA